MRNITEQRNLDRRILHFLQGCDPTPCGVVATALVESAFDVRAALHALVDAGELHKFSKPNGTEMFVAQSGGPGEAA